MCIVRAWRVSFRRSKNPYTSISLGGCLVFVCVFCVLFCVMYDVVVGVVVDLVFVRSYSERRQPLKQQTSYIAQNTM